MIRKTTNDMLKTPVSPAAGFTLIETAFVIVMIGLVLVPLFIFMDRQTEQANARAEEEGSRQILTALASYVKRNGFYPCPARRNFAPGTPNFGLAVNSTGAGNCTAGTVKAPGAAGFNVAFGEVPVRDLDLPVSMIANKKGWRYIYAVSENLTNAVGWAATNGAGQVRIRGFDAAGNPVANILGAGVFAPFVLVDTGDDGKGVSQSFYGGNPPIACAGNTDLDAENCNDDAVFIDAAFNPSRVAANTFYDDTISYTLSRQESTLWATQENAGAGGDLDISVRNTGNVGIGTDTANPPLDKLHVRAGDVRVMANGATGGTAQAGQDVNAQQDVNAARNVDAGVKVEAPVFYYTP